MAENGGAKDFIATCVSSIVIEVIRTVFIIIFILWKHFMHLKHEQKHLS